MIKTLIIIRDYIGMAVSQTSDALEVAETADEELMALPAYIGMALGALERIERRIEEMMRDRKTQP